MKVDVNKDWDLGRIAETSSRVYQHGTINWWMDFYRACGAESYNDCAQLALTQLDGYGIEYGFEPELDAVTLENAMKAASLILV